MAEENKTNNKALKDSDVKPKANSGEPQEKQTVEVDADVLKDMQEQIARLTAAADAGRLAKYDNLQRQKEEAMVQTVRINTWDDKIITSWRMSKNVSHVDRTKGLGALVEDQKIELTFEDGSKTEVDYITWGRERYNTQFIGEINRDSKTKDGRVVTVEIMNGRFAGKEVDININYVN